MGTQFQELSEQHIRFIEAQKIFFVGTATASSRINVSPKGLDSLRVVGPSRLVWLNLTGSTNESAAHVQEDPRMTLMFCALEGPPLILRAYGSARVIHRNDAQWQGLLTLFPDFPGARQIFDLHIELVMTSCGGGVPLFTYQGQRNNLTKWLAGKDEGELRQYWQQKNQVSIDGLPTNLLQKSDG